MAPLPGLLNCLIVVRSRRGLFETDASTILVESDESGFVSNISKESSEKYVLPAMLAVNFPSLDSAPEERQDTRESASVDWDSETDGFSSVEASEANNNTCTRILDEDRHYSQSGDKETLADDDPLIQMLE